MVTSQHEDALTSTLRDLSVQAQSAVRSGGGVSPKNLHVNVQATIELP